MSRVGALVQERKVLRRVVLQHEFDAVALDESTEAGVSQTQVAEQLQGFRDDEVTARVALEVRFNLVHKNVQDSTLIVNANGFRQSLVQQPVPRNSVADEAQSKMLQEIQDGDLQLLASHDTTHGQVLIHHPHEVERTADQLGIQRVVRLRRRRLQPAAGKSITGVTTVSRPVVVVSAIFSFFVVSQFFIFLRIRFDVGNGSKPSAWLSKDGHSHAIDAMNISGQPLLEQSFQLSALFYFQFSFFYSLTVRYLDDRHFTIWRFQNQPTHHNFN